MMDVTAFIIPVLILKLAAMMPGIASATLSLNMHPQCAVSSTVDGEVFDESLACLVALHHLDQYEVEDVLICRATKIEAPLSGYLVDAQGFWENGDREYSLFRLGVMDDVEDSNRAGEEFVFLAVGFSEDGNAFVYPTGANIEDPDGNFIWEHEFLLDEEEFFSVPFLFPR